MEENNTTTKICEICKVEKDISRFTVYGRNGYRRKMCKNCINQGLTMKDAPTPKESRTCPACNVLKPINQFYRNNSLITGYELRCKMCHNRNIKVDRGDSKSLNRKPYEQQWENYFNIVGVTKNDYKNMFVFLNKVGYNLEYDIHVQFCKKWGLTPSNPKKEFNNTFSPMDFNLI